MINRPPSIQIYRSPSNKAGLIPAVEDDDDAGNGESDDDDLSVHLGGDGTTLGYDTRVRGSRWESLGGLLYDEPADDAAAEEDESARKADWYVNGDIDVDIGPATVDLEVVRTIKGDDSDPTVGPATGFFGAKMTGNLRDLSLPAAGDVVLRRHRRLSGHHRI